MNEARGLFYVWTVGKAEPAAVQWARAAEAFGKRYGSAPALVVMRPGCPAPDGVQVDPRPWPMPRAWYMAVPAGAEGVTG